MLIIFKQNLLILNCSCNYNNHYYYNVWPNHRYVINTRGPKDKP